LKNKTKEEVLNDLGTKLMTKIDKDFRKYLRECAEHGIELHQFGGFIKMTLEDGRCKTEVNLYPEMIKY